MLRKLLLASILAVVPDRHRGSPTGARGPPDDEASARYDANPLLAVIESYALDVIGALSPEEVEEAELAVTAVYGPGLDWRGTVRAALRLDVRSERELAGAWARCRRAAKAAGRDPEPAEFARRFADDLVRARRS